MFFYLSFVSYTITRSIITFLVNLNEDVLEVEGSLLFRIWIFLWLLCIVWQLWSRLMEIFLLLAHVFIVCRHIPLELYRFFALTKYWRKSCNIGFLRQQNVDAKMLYRFLTSTFVDAKDNIWVFGVNKMLTQKMLYKFLALI